jgi:hypothetical protein
MQVTTVFGFMIKKRKIGDQIHDHNRGELACHPEASRDRVRDRQWETAFFARQLRDRAFEFGGAGHLKVAS